MTAMRTVHLALLKPFVPPGVFTRIDPDVEACLTPLPELRDRVLGCVEFCHTLHAGRMTGYSSEGKQVPDAEELSKRRKYLRAALAEFSSMDDAALSDFANLPGCSAPRMLSSPDPRLHAVRLLRHANIHLSATNLSPAVRDAVWDGPLGRQEFRFFMIVAEDVQSSIRATNDAKRYRPADLSAMLEWLDAEQREWGIDHTVLRCAETYAAIVASAV